jgi:hypothetical protein
MDILLVIPVIVVELPAFFVVTCAIFVVEMCAMIAPLAGLEQMVLA